MPIHFTGVSWTRLTRGLLCLSLMTLISPCNAAEDSRLKPADVVDSMSQTPPPKEHQVTFRNYRNYPFNRWAFRNINAPYNTLSIHREGQITPLQQQPTPALAKLKVTDGWGKSRSVEEILEINETDGIVVLRDNTVLFERYFGGMDQHDQHIWFSATKSLVSTALGILVDEGKVDLQASPADYIEELKGSGFERTTIQNVLNHSSAIDFKETYTDFESDFFKHYAPALNIAYLPGGRDAQPNNTEIYGVHDFLGRFIKADSSLKPGDEFDYNSTNADVAGWLVSRISGLPLHEFLQQKIWGKLGTEHDALIAADRAYRAVATAGMTSTTRDAALFGQMILKRGKVGSEQVIPAKWVDATLAVTETDRQKMRNNSKYQDNSWEAYKNMWWVIDSKKGEYAAVGVHGQVIYINRDANVVIAYFSSQPVASAARNPQFQSKLFAAQAMANYLKTH